MYWKKGYTTVQSLKSIKKNQKFCKCGRFLVLPSETRTTSFDLTSTYSRYIIYHAY